MRIEARAKEWAARFAFVGDVRRLGAMVGVELVRNRASKEPAKDETQRIVRSACEHGVLLIAARLQGVTNLGPWGVFAVFSSLILGVGGVSLFSVGISFNHLVALFHRGPIHQANLVSRILGPSPERHFGWFGLVVALCGAGLGAVSLMLGLSGWEITRIWLWMLGSALFVLG